MTDLFNEVEETLRRERYADWARRYWIWAVAAVGVLLGGLLAYEGYRYWSRGRAEVASAEFDAGAKLLAAGQIEEAERHFAALADRSGGGYKALSQLQRGGALLAQGDAAGAVAAFEAAAKAAPDPVFKDLATLKAAYAAADTASVQALETRLKPMIDAGGAFSYQARELLGVKAYEAGDVQRARREFNYLDLALEAPEGVRERAGLALAVLGPEGQSPGPETPASQPQPEGQAAEPETAPQTGDRTQ